MKQFFICFFLMIAAQGLMAQNNVGINTASPDASAVLDITSSNKGLLIPRLSQSERGGISSPATGLMIFQTDNTPGFYYNAGTAASPSWTAVGAGSSTSAASIFGNGAGGALLVPAGNTVDWATTATIPAQYSSITINGNLIVPTGTKLRCSGNVTISGTIVIASTPNPGKAAPGDKGIASSPALSNDITSGAKKFPASSISSLINIPIYGGGSGAGGGPTGDSNGGGGGGSFAIYASGNISVPSAGSVNANGANGINNLPTANTIGAGGGAGGLIVLVSKGTITIGGTLRANGGSGTSGVQITGSMRGGGGGGAGGVICLVAPGTPSVTGSIQVNGSSGGANTTTTNASSALGSNGGASGGDGGTGGSAIAGVSSTAGSVGLYKTILTSNPENLY